MSRLRLVARRVATASLAATAFVWRTLLWRTTIIAITGSVGKTTAKECLAAVLSAYYPTEKTIANIPGRWNLPFTLLRTRPWHRFVVAEVSTDRPGYIWQSALLLRPDIVIVLHIKGVHGEAFSTLEERAAEKRQLVARLGRRGVAILNGDDPHVIAMADRGRFEVITFGSSSAHDVWSSDVTSRWPGRLEFTAHVRTRQMVDGKRQTIDRETSSAEKAQRVRTQLVGTHWTPAVLAVLAAATRCGLTLEQAAAPLLDVAPFPARMQPVTLAVGAVVIRDDYNGSIETLGPAANVLEEADARRRWLVASDFTDLPLNYRHRLKRLGELAVTSADNCVFVGDKSDYAKRRAIEAGMAREHVHSFLLLKQAADLLQKELRSGDVVLLRGRVRDHLARIVFAQMGTVECWKTNCQKRCLCDDCPELGFRESPRLDRFADA